MPVHYVREGAPQALTLDGQRVRHLRRDCTLLRRSAVGDVIFDAVNTDSLRFGTVRCEHPPCWAAERRREGSPFGCVECGTTEIARPYRDAEGRYRLCPDCFFKAAVSFEGLRSAEVAARAFEPIVARYEVARRPSKYRGFKLYHCEACGRTADATDPLHVHHIDGDRRNNEQMNLQTLCETCHRHAHKGRRLPPYAERDSSI